MANAVVSAELTAQENLRSELDRALAQHKQVEEQRAEEINAELLKFLSPLSWS